MSRVRRLLFAFLAAVLLAGGCFAAPEVPRDGPLTQRLEDFRAAHGLNERNFSFYFYDTVTGEKCCFNETAMMTAASTFKLPLNLYYYEMEAAGEIAPDAWIPRAGTTLDVCHQRSIVDSNNEVSIGMLYNLGNFRTYKEKMRKYFTMTDEEISSAYYADNNYCTRMMGETLQYLYEHREQFPEMLDYMKQACPGHYFKKYISDVEIAHKYGSFDGAENDTGIFFTEQPFLLAVYTKGIGEDISARAALMCLTYNQEQIAEVKAAKAAADAALQAWKQTAAQKAAVQEAPVQTVEVPEAPAPAAPAVVLTWWMIPLALAVFLLGSGIVLWLLRTVSKRKFAPKVKKDF